MISPVPEANIGQADIASLLAQGRITDVPAAVRVARAMEAGGFADASRYPTTWITYFFVDGQWAYVRSARGNRREWTSLDRLEKWLRSMSFRFFVVRNDLDPTPQADADLAEEIPSP